jgi:hypothetical protein
MRRQTAPPPPPIWPPAIEYAWAHCHLHPQFLPVVPSGLCVRDFARAVHAAERLEPEVVVKVQCPRTGAALQGHAWLHPGDAVEVVRRAAPGPPGAPPRPALVVHAPETWPYWDPVTGRPVATVDDDAGDDDAWAADGTGAESGDAVQPGPAPARQLSTGPLATAAVAFMTLLHSGPGMAVSGVAVLGPGGAVVALPPTWVPEEAATTLQATGPAVARAVLDAAPHLRILYTDHLWAGSVLEADPGTHTARLQFAPVHHPVLAALRRQCAKVLRSRVPPWSPPRRLLPLRPPR